MPSAVEHEAGKSRDGDNEVEVPDRARFSQEEEAVSRRRAVLLKSPLILSASTDASGAVQRAKG